MTLIRDEHPLDCPAIGEVVKNAFTDLVYSSNDEDQLVERLREKSELVLSLVAELEGRVVGHIGFSKVTINNQFISWYGLGPLSVRKDYQKRGIGSALVNNGLKRIRDMGANGCVVLGDPQYYSRFGFQCLDSLELEGVLPEHFQVLCFKEPKPEGIVKYCSVFDEFS
ncbi:N-acetyltransferase [bacterium]|jgi:putative acetyltransferase|nr:N-acetyltransferase [bacterium]